MIIITMQNECIIFGNVWRWIQRNERLIYEKQKTKDLFEMLRISYNNQNYHCASGVKYVHSMSSPSFFLFFSHDCAHLAGQYGITNFMWRVHCTWTNCKLQWIWQAKRMKSATKTTSQKLPTTTQVSLTIWKLSCLFFYNESKWQIRSAKWCRYVACKILRCHPHSNWENCEISPLLFGQ